MKRKVLFLGCVFISILVLGGMGCKDDTASNPYNQTNNPPPPNTFTMAGAAFAPTSMRISRGTTITWHNTDSAPHTATSDSVGVWDTGNIPPGTSVTTPFNTAGTFPFHCTYHRAMGMVGTITVQ